MSKKDLVQKALVGAKLSLCTLSGTVNLEGIITPIQVIMREDSIGISAGDLDMATSIFEVHTNAKELVVIAGSLKQSCIPEIFQQVIETIFPVVMKQYGFKQSKYSIVNNVTL